MNPWDIIGWMILGTLGTLVAIVVGLWLFRLAVRVVLSLATRRVAPAVGQVWTNGDDELEIREVYETGLLLYSPIRSGSISWSETFDTWNRRVRSDWLYLLRSPS